MHRDGVHLMFPILRANVDKSLLTYLFDHMVRTVHPRLETNKLGAHHHTYPTNLFCMLIQLSWQND